MENALSGNGLSGALVTLFVGIVILYSIWRFCNIVFLQLYAKSIAPTEAYLRTLLMAMLVPLGLAGIIFAPIVGFRAAATVFPETIAASLTGAAGAMVLFLVAYHWALYLTMAGGVKPGDEAGEAADDSAREEGVQDESVPAITPVRKRLRVEPTLGLPQA